MDFLKLELSYLSVIIRHALIVDVDSTCTKLLVSARSFLNYKDRWLNWG